MNTLERLKELARKATPGPWVNEDHMIYGPKHEQSKHRNGRVYITRIEQGVVRADPALDGGADRFGFDSMADTALIVAAINALPDLLEIAEAAREVNGWDLEWFINREYCEDAKAIRTDLRRLDAALAKLTEEV